MNPKLIIEVAGGMVNSVYHQGSIPANLEVIVVDVDGEAVGEPTTPILMQIEELREASEIVRNSIEHEPIDPYNHPA